MGNYVFKKKGNTLHQYVINKLPWNKEDNIIELGANEGALSHNISGLVKRIVAVDEKKPLPFKGIIPLELDLNSDFQKFLDNEKFDKVIALDVIEHLHEPEKAVEKINNILKNNGKLYASTANIAYFGMRAALLVGRFNYGERGILDKTHHRLFTISSFKKLLINNGFKIEKIVGFGPPIADVIGNKGIFKMLDEAGSFLARLMPSLFGFNFLIIARKFPFKKGV